MFIKKYLKSLADRSISSQFYEHLAIAKEELKVGIVHKKGVKAARRYHGQSNLKINFGCGPHKKEGFLNLDYSPEADIRLDLRQPIPLLDSCAVLCYSEHFMEHLSYPEGAEQFVWECYRLLVPGGEFSVSVPDTDFMFQEFPNEGKEFIESEWGGTDWHPKECTTLLEHINYHFRQRWRGKRETDFDNHRFAYDFITMKKLLTNCGFKDVQRRKFDPAVDSPHRQKGSLFVKAYK